MGDFGQSPPPLPLFIHTYSVYSAAFQRRGAGTTGVATITWPVASTAFYIPFFIPWMYPVQRVFWVNGTSTTSTNMDFGIYSESGTRIYSTGSTAAGTVSVPTYTTPGTPFMLSPGRYFFALADSSTVASTGGQGSTTPSVVALRQVGVLQEASALPLPATMTGAAVANACYPLCGITRTASGF